jgi:N-acetylglutamate synthase/N-acetylornithine aminotransferase
MVFFFTRISILENQVIKSTSQEEYKVLSEAFTDVAIDLAKLTAFDGEGISLHHPRKKNVMPSLYLLQLFFFFVCVLLLCCRCCCRCCPCCCCSSSGATKFVTVAVTGARSFVEARTVGRTVGTSPLVKTALFASDANWGRILVPCSWN